jgi:hypothetical protein
VNWFEHLNTVCTTFIIIWYRIFCIFGVEDPGFRIPAHATGFSLLKNDQTGSGAHTPTLLVTEHWGSFLEMKWPVVQLNTHIGLLPRIRMSGSVPLLRLYANME